MEFNEILRRVKKLAKERHDDAPAEHIAAFANAVAYAVIGCSGGYGGPSMREHLAARKAPPSLSFERAVELCEPICFGPLTLEVARMLTEEHCFEDAPGEQEEAIRLLQEAGEDLEEDEFF